MKYAFLLILVLTTVGVTEASICFGTTANGWLEGGVRLPIKGKNFVAYSTIGYIAGRTFVHSEVKEIIIGAYEALEEEQPGKVFKYAESGFKKGGLFKPHKTHRNGLSVDFMTPVITPEGKSVHLSTHSLNKFGYNIEFDQNGKYKDLSIDYVALAAHIVSLHKVAIYRRHNIWRVIFDPELQPNLFETKYGDYLQKNINFTKKKSWVRHDEHYHIDFDIPCK